MRIDSHQNLLSQSRVISTLFLWNFAPHDWECRTKLTESHSDEKNEKLFLTLEIEN